MAAQACFFTSYIYSFQRSYIGGPGSDRVWDGIRGRCALYKTVSTVLIACLFDCFVFSCSGFCITEGVRSMFWGCCFFFCHFICACSQSAIIFLLGNVTEPSTPSSCSTWKTTNLKCAYEPKTPTDRAAAHSRILLRDLRVHFTIFGVK